MNIFWIVGLTVLILLEKTIPMGRIIPRIAGVFLIGLGLNLSLQMYPFQ